MFIRNVHVNNFASVGVYVHTCLIIYSVHFTLMIGYLKSLVLGGKRPSEHWKRNLKSLLTVT